MRFSASRLNTWMSCPLQAKFKYGDKLPEPQGAKASFGTVIHHALELYNATGDVELAKATFAENWENPAKLGVAPEVWPKFTTFGGLRERGLQILDEYHAHHAWDDREIIGTEHKFLVPFGEHELTGIIDLAEIRRSGRGKNILRIVDYKTASKKPTYAELALNVQLTIYDFAATQPEFWIGNGPDFPGLPNGEWLFETLKDMPRRVIWYHLWGNTEIDAGSRDEDDYLRVYRALEQVQRAIEADVYVPDISGQSCTFCAYVADPCPVTKIPPRPEELREEENAWL